MADKIPRRRVDIYDIVTYGIIKLWIDILFFINYLFNLIILHITIINNPIDYYNFQNISKSTYFSTHPFNCLNRRVIFDLKLSCLV